MGMQGTGQAWPHLQQEAQTCSTEGMGSLPTAPHRLVLGAEQARLCMVLLWLLWAPASRDLHLTLPPRISLVPMSAADIKLGGAVGFLKGKGTSGWTTELGNHQLYEI